MEPIPVESAFKITGYSSADAAIAAAVRHPLLAKARDEATIFLGRKFIDGWFNLQEYVLEYSGPIWLRIFTNGSLVDWEVKHERPNIISLNESIIYDWGSIGVHSTNCPALLADRRNSEFSQFWAGELGFNVYWRGKLYLCFNTVRRRDTGEILLSVSEEEGWQ